MIVIVFTAVLSVLIKWINVTLPFAGGFEVPQDRFRRCPGPHLQAASPQPYRSPLTTECHRPPMGAQQLSPAPTPNLSRQEIVSPPAQPAYLLPRGGGLCPPQETLGQHVLVSLPWALNCHYSGTFYEYTCIPTLLCCTVWCHYICLVLCLEVFVFLL